MAEKESKSLSDFWWSFVPFGALIDRKKIAEGLNRNWHWLFVSAIVCGGIVFIILALIFKLIDAESGRYLLSAIVQALAALLAIIFAGVAILWGREHEAESKLEKIHEENTDKLNEIVKSPNGKGKLIEAFRVAFQNTFFDKDGKKKDGGEWPVESKATQNFIEVFRQISSWSYYFEKSKPAKREEIESKFRQIAVNYPRGKTTLELYGYAEFVDQFYDVEAFEYFMGRILMWASLGVSEVEKDSLEHEIFKKVIILAKTHDTRKVFIQLLRGKRARGPWFIFLISLYAITIAGGMVALAVMKGQGICDLQASWIAAGPLAFAIGAVAMTFLYLYNLVKGEKE